LSKKEFIHRAVKHELRDPSLKSCSLRIKFRIYEIKKQSGASNGGPDLKIQHSGG
jgi:hypothetical protein